LAIQDNDLVVATHGRSFWILDDLTPLRQLDQQVLNSDVYLFKPETAIRARRDVNRDTPLPLETPVGQNPPNGAIIDYYLKSAPPGPITLNIVSSQGSAICTFVSGQKPKPFPKLLVFSYAWLRHPRPLTKKPGLNRFVWNLRYPDPPALSHDYSIAAVIGRSTPQLPRGPLVVPGNYTVKLIVGSHSYEQPLAVKMDPRVTTSASGLAAQFDLELKLSQGLTQDYDTYRQIKALEAQVKSVETQLAPNRRATATLADLKTLGRRTAEIETGSDGAKRMEGLAELSEDLASLETTADSADRPPTAQCQTAADQKLSALKAQIEQWNEIKGTEVPALNGRLRNFRIVPLVPRSTAPAAE
jgi:hypothetical protein